MSLQHLSPDYDLASHTTYIVYVCVLILYIIIGAYNLKSTLKDSFLWETFHGNFYFPSEFLQEFSDRKSVKKIFKVLSIVPYVRATYRTIYPFYDCCNHPISRTILTVVDKIAFTGSHSQHSLVGKTLDSSECAGVFLV